MRVCAASFRNKEIKILAYHEKRQDVSYFSNGECRNLPGLCDNISEVISYIEKELEYTFAEIVINYPFGELFLASKKINFKRKLPHKNITIAELEDIMESIEKLCLTHLSAEVDKLYGLGPDEIQILLSRVNSVTIDGTAYQKVIGKQGENMKFSLLNAFIPISKHNLLSQIWNVVGKKIYRILPAEFCITKIFPQPDIVIINIGATQTTLSLKKEGDVGGISKISIGINDLVTLIAKKNKQPRALIIDSLNTDIFLEEKKTFLATWGESIGITLKEMLKNTICPKYFYIGWGGGNNDFIKEYLLDFPFAKYDLKVVNKIQYVSEDMGEVLAPMTDIKLEYIQKIPLDIYTLLLETNHLIAREKDVISTTLKAAIKKLGYIKS